MRSMPEMRIEVRRRLSEWGSVLIDIERLENEKAAYLEKARNALETLHAQRLSGMPRGGITRDLSDVIADAEEAERMYHVQAERINQIISEMLESCNTLDNLIQDLTPRAREIIARRYKRRENIRSIAMHMFMSERTVHRYIETSQDYIAHKLMEKEDA